MFPSQTHPTLRRDENLDVVCLAAAAAFFSSRVGGEAQQQLTAGLVLRKILDSLARYAVQTAGMRQRLAVCVASLISDCSKPLNTRARGIHCKSAQLRVFE